MRHGSARELANVSVEPVSLGGTYHTSRIPTVRQASESSFHAPDRTAAELGRITDSALSTRISRVALADGTHKPSQLPPEADFITAEVLLREALESRRETLGNRLAALERLG